MEAKLTRRSLLAGGAAAAFASGTGRALAAPGASAELVVRNAKIITVDETKPRAEAMAVRGGRILDVGTEEDIHPSVSRETEVVDAKGKCVTPGLIDAHSHVIGYGQMQLKFVLLRPPKVHSFQTLCEALAAAAKEKPEGEWIVGRGFTDFDEGRFPFRWELDEAVPKHPVLLIHWGGQFGVANTLGLRKANLFRADVKDPYGGKYLRDPQTGLPEGRLLHYPAIYSVYQPVLDEKESVECAQWGLERFAEEGVTCVHDNFCHPAYAVGYVRLEQRGTIPCRVRIYPYVKNLEMCKAMIDRVFRYRGRLVRLQGLKLAVDGYALMYEVPSQHERLEIPMHPQPVFNEIIRTIHDAGLQADVHAVGDKGVDWTLEAYAKASGSTEACRRRRHRIEHFPFRKLDSIRRAAEMGVPVCVQPNFVAIRADEMRRRLGLARGDLIDTMVPTRTFQQEGVHLAFGADVPAFPSHSPLDSLRSAVERTTAGRHQLDTGEAISFMDALRHHTLGSAYAASDEQELGSLTRGKLADFAIWEGDLDSVRTGADVHKLKVAATYLAGRRVSGTAVS